MTTRTTTSIVIDAPIIFSRIHAQDSGFRGEIADRDMARRTVPIVWPNGSQIAFSRHLVTWSVVGV